MGCFVVHWPLLLGDLAFSESFGLVGLTMSSEKGRPGECCDQKYGPVPVVGILLVCMDTTIAPPPSGGRAGFLWIPVVTSQKVQVP